MFIRKQSSCIAVAFLFMFASAAPAGAAAEVDALSYKIDLHIMSERISESVELTATSKKSVKKLNISLASSVEILSCKLNGSDVPFEHAGWDVELDLSKAGAPKDEFTLVFELEGKPHNFQRNRFLRTVISPEHAYIRSQYAWYPRIHDDPAQYETTVRLRKDWNVRTAGDVAEIWDEGDDRVWRFVLSKPCRAIGFAAGEYEIVERVAEGGIAIDALCFPGDEEGARRLLETVAQAIRFYTSIFGPMSEKRFTLVEMPAEFGEYSGYGMTGYCLVGSGSFKKGGGDSLVAHEVSHTWWGREVGFTNFANEMLATYSTNRYLERYLGKDAAREERERFRKNVTSLVNSRGGTALASIQGWGGGLDSAIYSAHAYDKAAMLLHALEIEMGRAAFDDALKAFFQSCRDQLLDYESVARELGGSRYKWLFEQWGSPAIPSLSTEYELKKSGSSYKIKGTLLQEGTKKPFRMGVTLRAISGDETQDVELKVKKSKTPFKLTCSFEPDDIIIDPDCHLIFSEAGSMDAALLSSRAFNVGNSPTVGDEKQLIQAISDFKKLIKLVEVEIEEKKKPSAKISECHAAIGRCLFRMGKSNEAKEKLEFAINMRDSGPFWCQWIYLRLGNIADMNRKRSEAMKYYQMAVDIKRNGSGKAAQMAADFLKRPYKSYKRDG